MVAKAGHGEVVLPAPGADAQGESPARDLVQRRGLLGQQHRLARGGQKDVGHERNAFGDGGRRGQRHQLLVGRIRLAADGGQRRKAKRLRTSRDFDQQTSVAETLVGVGKPEPDLQAAYATGIPSPTRSSASTLPSFNRICRRA